MRRLTTTIAAACAALTLTDAAAAAQTVPPDRTTYVTFSGPVSIPGMTLPAGTYTFRIADSQTDRHIVQIFNREGTKLFTTLLAVPAQRNEPSGDPVITFKETPSDRPPAVHYWYYAGDLAGNELVYPKNQAVAIANASHESVMAVDSNGSSIEDWKSGDISKVSPEAQPSANATPAPSASSSSTTSPAAAPSPAPTPATTTDQAASQPSAAAGTQPTTTADQTPQSSAPPSSASTSSTSASSPAPAGSMDQDRATGTSGRTPAKLPKTASELPMVGLIGLLALGGAVAIRVSRSV